TKGYKKGTGEGQRPPACQICEHGKAGGGRVATKDNPNKLSVGGVSSYVYKNPPSIAILPCVAILPRVQPHTREFSVDRQTNKSSDEAVVVLSTPKGHKEKGELPITSEVTP
ncbi:unnamed protein product, partial [Ilex paraguariensis]